MDLAFRHAGKAGTDTDEEFDAFTDRAIEALADLERADPELTDPDITASLAMRQMSISMGVKADTPADAVRIFSDLVSKAPNHSTFHYHLGMAYQKMDQPVAAREQLKQVLKISPNFTDANTTAADLKKTISDLGGM
jgi:predicted Zn-dependent protease